MRREKARVFSGCKSRPATLVAPAGSNRSGGGGNETAGAFDAKGRLGDSASRQAVTRVNAEQAPKGLTWEPTRREIGEGRRHWGTGGHTPRSDANQWSHRGIGDGMSAEEIRRNTGSPERWGRDPNRTPVRARPGRPGWRTGPSAKAIQRLCREISELTGRQWAWLDEGEQVARLNRKLEGWANYFRLGQVTKAYQAVDRHACHRLRQWLRSKYQSRTMGYSRCPNESLHERLGLVRLKGRTRDFPWAKA